MHIHSIKQKAGTFLNQTLYILYAAWHIVVAIYLKAFKMWSVFLTW